jgi:outer membrane receptor for ferric coprogen and ferric-rhodotorulic acid
MASRPDPRCRAAAGHSSSPLKSALRATCIATGLLAAMAASPIALAQASGAAATRSFQVPAGPLATALAGFAADAGVSVSAPPELVRGVVSPGLDGSFAVSDGLARLLAGTGLEAVPGAPRTWVLRRRAAAPVAEAAGGTLNEVRVTATAINDGTTEGSGSYVAGPSSTATRLGLSLRETPQSVSVITRQQMDDQGLTNLPEILEKTVGVTVGRNDSERATFYARGFSVENFQFDGVPNTMDSASQFTTSLADSAIYDRVEVVKGATGLLTGAGNPSATINLVRKKPTSEFAGSVSAGVGSYDRYRTVGDFSGPLNESGSVRGRVVAAVQNANSYVDRYGRDTRNLYGIVEVDLAPRTLLSLGVDHMETRAKGASYGHIPLFYNDGTQTRFPRSFNPAARWSYWNNESTNVFATLKHDFGNGWKLDLATSYLKQSRDVEVGAASYGAIDPLTGAGISLLSAKIPTTATVPSLNAAVSGPFELFGRQHELSFGLGWSRQRREAPGYSSAFGPIANYLNWQGDAPRPDFVHQEDRTTRITEKGAFAAVRLRPTDALSVILGTRVSWYRLFDETTGLDGSYSVADNLSVDRKVIPYAGLVYDINRQFSVYASYTDIFNPQTYYKDAADRALPALTGKSLEIGVKGELLDRRLNTSFALFQVKQQNAAQYVGSSPVTGLEVYRAIDGVTTRGLEAEVSGQITPDWNIAGGYTLRRSTIPPQPDEILSAVNTNQPKHLVKLSTSYRLPGDWRRLVIGGSFSWQSETYYQTSDGTGWRATQPAYALVGLMARYEFDRHLSLSLNISNLFDKTYMPGLGSYGTGVYGDRRSALLSATYKF